LQRNSASNDAKRRLIFVGDLLALIVPIPRIELNAADCFKRLNVFFEADVGASKVCSACRSRTQRKKIKQARLFCLGRRAISARDCARAALQGRQFLIRVLLLSHKLILQGAKVRTAQCCLHTANACQARRCGTLLCLLGLH